MQRCHRLLAFGIAFCMIAPIAHAAQIIATATLSGASENPVNASPGTGTTFVVLDTTSHSLRVQVVFSGLVAGTTAAHIHCCVVPPGNAGVSTTTPYFAGFPIGVTSGSYDQTFDTTQASTWNAPFITASGGTPLGAEAALAAGIAAGTAYLNVHSSTYPGGEIRGFLAPQGVAPAPVGADIPTLSEWAMVGLILLLLAAGWSMLRRRAR
jgi:hypothetical protein